LRSALTVRGNAVDPKTGREFFLDYPCDLKLGEKVNFILNIHGAGSSGNWQRHYFPAKDYKEKHRLVIATPTAATGSPTRMWTAEADDAHLQNIADLIFDQFGRKNIKSFWLAGHSQGGMTSNRIVCTDYFRDKVDGWLSLSGGRIGRAEIAPDFFGSGGPPAALAGGGPNAPRPGAAATPTCDFSYIFTTGEMEIVSLPEASPWAEKYGCADRVRKADIIDTQKGYVTGARAGRPASWGREARPGTAQEYLYPKCKDGKIVADVVRLDKGHTEGLEPKVTEHLIRMMTSAPGGKGARAS
jgi:poly(3-hydroxybutyrate) depolymerase